MSRLSSGWRACFGMMAGLVVLLVVSEASGFNLNPSNRGAASSTTNSRFWDGINEDVHESLTRESRLLYHQRCLQHADRETCVLPIQGDRIIYDSLIRGNWWADDPNQLLYKARQGAWFAQILDAGRRAKKKRYKIDGKYKMHYRSHYGDMQFLHSMASADDKDAELTKKRILMWAEFLYRVSVGELTRETRFREIEVGGLSEFFPGKKIGKFNGSCSHDTA